MRWPDFLLPFCLSAVLHASVLLPGAPYRPAEARFKKGASAVTLDIVTPEVVPPPEVAPPPEMTEAPLPEPAARVELAVEPAAPVELPSTESNPEDRGVRSLAMLDGFTRPVYPAASRRRGEEGTVVFSIEVLASGERGKIEMMSSSGYSRLDRAALEALEKAEFIPAALLGRPVSSTKRIAFTFRLEDY